MLSIYTVIFGLHLVTIHVFRCPIPQLLFDTIRREVIEKKKKKTEEKKKTRLPRLSHVIVDRLVARTIRRRSLLSFFFLFSAFLLSLILLLTSPSVYKYIHLNKYINIYLSILCNSGQYQYMGKIGQARNNFYRENAGAHVN